MAQLIQEAKRMQKLAGIITESEYQESAINETKTLADIPEKELGSSMDKPKEWKGKKLTIIDGTFADKYPDYKGTEATFNYYDNMSGLVAVELHDGKSVKLNRKELEIK